MGLFAFLFFVLAPVGTVLAQETENGAPGPQGPCASTDTLGACIIEIYRWSLGTAVLLALAMIVLAGYLYMSAGGDAQRVTKAKDLFANAFIGLIILFSAVLILRTINPDLVSLPEDPAVLQDTTAN